MISFVIFLACLFSFGDLFKYLILLFSQAINKLAFQLFFRMFSSVLTRCSKNQDANGCISFCSFFGLFSYLKKKKTTLDQAGDTLLAWESTVVQDVLCHFPSGVTDLRVLTDVMASNK